jgi:hypothetical protein
MLSCQLFAQQMAMPSQTRRLEFFYQLSGMFQVQRVSSRNYSIAFGGDYKI